MKYYTKFVDGTIMQSGDVVVCPDEVRALVKHQTEQHRNGGCKVAYIIVNTVEFPERGNSIHITWMWTANRGWFEKERKEGFSVHH